MSEQSRVTTQTGWGIVSPQTGAIIMSSIRSTKWASLLCWMRDYRLSARGFESAGYRCAEVRVELKQ